MIKTILDYLYITSGKEKNLNTFHYNYPDKILGNGDDIYPLILVEEPIKIDNYDISSLYGNTVTVNVQILVNSKENSKVENQESAEQILNNLIAYIKEDNVMKIKNYSTLYLSNYTDDASFGIRATITASIKSEIDLCDYLSNFDDTKIFSTSSKLYDINTDSPTECSTTFSYRLPKFNFMNND